MWVILVYKDTACRNGLVQCKKKKYLSALSSQVMYHNNNHCQAQNGGVSFREGDESRTVVIMQP